MTAQFTAHAPPRRAGVSEDFYDDGLLRVEHDNYYVECAGRQLARFHPMSLHVHIYRLRRRLAPHGVRIETMVNVGYRLVAGGGAD